MRDGEANDDGPENSVMPSGRLLLLPRRMVECMLCMLCMLCLLWTRYVDGTMEGECAVKNRNGNGG